MKSIIKVGNSAATSGIFATTGDPIVAGIKAYFDMVNKEEIVQKYSFELCHIDDEYNPEKAVEVFNELVNKDKVFAFVSHFGAPVVRSTLPLMKEKGMPIVGFATGIGELYYDGNDNEMSNAFPIQPIYITEGRAMVARIVSMNQNKSITKIGIIYMDEDTGHDIKNGVEIQSNILGIDCEFQMVSKDMSNLEACVKKINKEDIDFIVVGSSQAYFSTIIESLQKNQNKKSVMTTYLNSIITIAYKTSKVLNDSFEIYALSWLNYDEKRSVNLELASEYLSDYAMNGYAHCGWICAHFFVEGIRRLGDLDLTYENYIKAMESEDFDIPFGGKVSYKNGKRLGTAEMSLVKLDLSFPTGWRPVDGLRSFSELLMTNEFYS